MAELCLHSPYVFMRDSELTKPRDNYIFTFTILPFHATQSEIQTCLKIYDKPTYSIEYTPEVRLNVLWRNAWTQEQWNRIGGLFPR
jgi:hypothetical protein